MAKITNLSEMKDYVLRKLGHPVINIELSNDQLEQEIEDAVLTMQRYNYDEGSYRDYFILQTSAGQQDYAVSAIRDYSTSATLDNVQHVWDFSLSFGMDGINTLFSPANVLLHQQYVEQGNYPGGPGGSNGLILTNYQTAMMYLDEINSMFGKMYAVDYLPGREVIRITPTPNRSLIGVLTLWRAEYAHNLYNNLLVRRLAVANAGTRWILNLSKYVGTLPDGLSINTTELYQVYSQEKEKVEQAMYDESHTPDILIY